MVAAPAMKVALAVAGQALRALMHQAEEMVLMAERVLLHLSRACLLPTLVVAVVGQIIRQAVTGEAVSVVLAVEQQIVLWGSQELQTQVAAAVAVA